VFLLAKVGCTLKNVTQFIEDKVHEIIRET